MRRDLLALVLSANVMVAHAANITMEASGALTEFSDPGGLLPFAEPGTGTEFSLRLTYDDATPDSIPVPEAGNYDGAISAMTLSFGAESFQLQPVNFITVIDDAVSTQPGEVYDLWVAKTLTETPTGNSGETLLEGFGIIFVEENPPPVSSLTSDDLVVPGWPGAWTTAMIFYNVQLETVVNGNTTIETLANVNRFSNRALKSSFQF